MESQGSFDEKNKTHVRWNRFRQMKEWDHNIDNLYRRAADEYPLNTNSGEWHKVESKLYEGMTAPEKVNKSHLGRNTVIAALVVLLFALGFHEFFTYLNVHTVSAGKEDNSTKQSTESIAETPNAPNHANESTVQQTIVETDATPKREKKITETAIGVQNNLSFGKEGQTSTRNDFRMVLDETTTNQEAFDNVTDDFSEELFFKKMPGNQALVFENKIPFFPSSSLMDNQQPSLIQSNISLLNTSLSKQMKEPVKVTLKLPPFFKKLYFGITGSPEFSKVKNSGFTTPGSSFALVAGFQLNNHLSIETGVRRNNLFFKSVGDHYNRSNLKNINERAIISTLNGYNRVTELPFLVRLKSESFSKNNFSIAAGTSLTISHQENYNYRLYQIDRSINAAREYNKSPAQLFNNMYVSAAYERDLGFQTSLRIEPYYKIPLRGLGAGELPVTGMGIHTGFIKYFK